MKCDKCNFKLEKFEGMVDGVMNWIYDVEFFVFFVVEGMYEVVKECIDRFEVNVDFCVVMFVCVFCFLLLCVKWLVVLFVFVLKCYIVDNVVICIFVFCYVCERVKI